MDGNGEGKAAQRPFGFVAGASGRVHFIRRFYAPYKKVLAQKSAKKYLPARPGDRVFIIGCTAKRKINLPPSRGHALPHDANDEFAFRGRPG